jgi:Raf kinase inhibitor-like YbhB/YbcL family protein
MAGLSSSRRSLCMNQRMILMLPMLVCAAAVAVAQAPQGAAPQVPPLLMTTTAFEDGGIFPLKYTLAVDAPISPALTWSQVPPGTRSFALLFHDPEPVVNKSAKTDITHWLVWNIPGTATGLPEGMPRGERPDGSRQTGLRTNGYLGPGGPATAPYHHFTFELYALDTTIDVPQGTPQQVMDTRRAVFDAMDGHVLGKAVLVGRFRRPK